MGLGISLTVTVIPTVFDANITHSLVWMWRAAGIYDALYNSQGKKAKEVLPILEAGYEKMFVNPMYFIQINREHGTESYGTALAWLLELIHNYREYPEGVIWISK